MIITYFSDSHAHHQRVDIPKSDLLIFGGDCMTDGYLIHEMLSFIEWLQNQPARYILFIAGNHDRLFENNPGLVMRMLEKYAPDVTYLENSGVEIEGVKIWGTPDTKIFNNWAFNRTEDELDVIADMIPLDTNILVSHGPARGVLDRLERGEHVGERSLMYAKERLHSLKYHLVGHVHSTVGYHEDEATGLITINGCICNPQYKPVNKPITFEYVKENTPEERNKAAETERHKA